MVTAPLPSSSLPFPAKSTHLDGVSHPVGMGEGVSVHVQDVQPLEFLLLGAHVLQPQEASVVGAWLGVSQVEGLQEVALGVGRSQEEACLWRKQKNS